MGVFILLFFDYVIINKLKNTKYKKDSYGRSV